MVREIFHRHENPRELDASAKERLKGYLGNTTFEIIPDIGNIAEQIGFFPPNSNIAITKFHKRDIKRSIELADELENRGLKEIAIHVAANAIESPEQAIKIAEYINAHSGHAFVVGGDIDKNEVELKQDGLKKPFGSALSLLNFWKINNVLPKRIGVAGYPTGHKNISLEQLMEALKQKQDFQRENKIDMYIVTQMSFGNPKKILEWIRKIRQANIKLDVIVGIPGMVYIKPLLKFIKDFGTESTLDILFSNPELAIDIIRYRLGKLGTNVHVFDSQKILEKIAIEDRESLISGVRFFTFNQVEDTVNLYKRNK